MTGSPRIIGTVPIGTYVTVTHDGHPHDGTIALVAYVDPNTTGGIGGGGAVRIESPMGGIIGRVSRYTRVTIIQS